MFNQNKQNKHTSIYHFDKCQLLSKNNTSNPASLGQSVLFDLNKCVPDQVWNLRDGYAGVDKFKERNDQPII